jgi:3-dehydroquinate dehydratase
MKRGLDIAEIRIDRSSARTRRTCWRSSGASAGADHRHDPQRREAGTGAARPDRLALLEAVLPDVDGIDVELGSRVIVDGAVHAVHALGKLAILSFHDFGGTPDPKVLDAVVERSKSKGADIVKVATLVTSRRDLGVLAQLRSSPPTRKSSWE